MTRANGPKPGTTTRMVMNDDVKSMIPERQAFAEFCKALSIVPTSEVKRLRMRPMGVISKKRDGARVILESSDENSDRAALRLA